MLLNKLFSTYKFNFVSIKTFRNNAEVIRSLNPSQTHKFIDFLYGAINNHWEHTEKLGFIQISKNNQEINKNNGKILTNKINKRCARSIQESYRNEKLLIWGIALMNKLNVKQEHVIPSNYMERDGELFTFITWI